MPNEVRDFLNLMEESCGSNAQFPNPAATLADHVPFPSHRFFLQSIFPVLRIQRQILIVLTNGAESMLLYASFHVHAVNVKSLECGIEMIMPPFMMKCILATIGLLLGALAVHTSGHL
jgi:hypothetical protein